VTKEIWVYPEIERSEITRVSQEVLSEAKRLADSSGQKLCALLVDNSVDDPAKALSQYEVEKAYLIEDKSLSVHDIDSLVNILYRIIYDIIPGIILFGATSLGRELAPRLAARLKAILFTECVDLKIEEGQLIIRRPVFNGKAHATMVGTTNSIQIATVSSGVFDIKKSTIARDIEIVKVVPESETCRVEFVEFIKGNPRTLSLNEAEIILAIGRGVGDREKLHIIEELAEALSATIGGTRAAVDNRLVSQENQIGLTGKTVAPRLFISCGISGQYPHTVGMDGSEIIIVINNDRDAPMFKLASLGIPGDLNEIVPVLTKHIKERISRLEEGRQ
jgi:electron transfer flavoprotein alpha subunit